MKSWFIPDDDPRQTLRLRRFFMGTSFYGIWLSIVGLMIYQDVLSVSAPLLAVEICGAIISNMIFYTLLRSGMNKQLADPSMTFAQLTVGIAWAMVLLISAHEVRDLMLIAYISPVLFGMFKLDQKGFTRLAIVAMTGFLLVTGLDFLLRPEVFDPTLALLRVVVVTLMLCWSSYFGLHVSRLKGRLRQQSRDLKKMVAEVTELSERDDLTKAYNRRFIMDSLGSEKSRSDRTGVPFSICILDLDHFKLINDRFGHLAGDRVLTAFAERARSEIRNLDLMGRKDNGTWFGRYGGEEFIVLLPNTSLLGARNCAERIRHVTASTAFEDVLHVTVSGGVTQYRIGEDVEDTLRRADQALYNAKHGGRNRVDSAGDLGSTHVPSDFGSQVVIGLFGKGKSPVTG
jgi:diguanylate cyclase (GGDEF)-like protein